VHSAGAGEILSLDPNPNNFKTSSSATAKSPCDASCLSVANFNNIKRPAQSFIVSYICVRFTTAYTIKCCCVEFGVTLRLFDIHIVALSRRQQTTPLTCSNLLVGRGLVYFAPIALRASQHAIKLNVRSDSRFLPTTPAFDGVTVGI